MRTNVPLCVTGSSTILSCYVFKFLAYLSDNIENVLPVSTPNLPTWNFHSAISHHLWKSPDKEHSRSHCQNLGWIAYWLPGNRLDGTKTRNYGPSKEEWPQIIHHYTWAWNSPMEHPQVVWHQWCHINLCDQWTGVHGMLHQWIVSVPRDYKASWCYQMTSQHSGTETLQFQTSMSHCIEPSHLGSSRRLAVGELGNQ